MLYMQRYIVVLLLMFLCPPSWAQEIKILDMVSPNLREFLLKRPKDLECLTNVLSSAFKSRKVELFYYYSSNESSPRFFQTYPSELAVNISIRENQKPVDQFICLLYEALNSEGAEAIGELCRKAKSGDVSRIAFAMGCLRSNLMALKKLKF